MNELKSLKLGKLEIFPPILLAPLAGFTDSPFRRIVREFGAGLMSTEMISSVGIYYKDQKTISLANFDKSEHPIAAQIFGSFPDKLAYAASFLESKGFDVIDINIGCPTLKIIKSGSGGALLKDLDLIKEILTSVRKAIKIPLTIKARKGFKKDENILKELINMAEGEGVDAVTIHGITVEEGFLKSAEDWSSIKEVKKVSSIPIIANGGIEKEQDVKSLFETTFADGVMVGRSAINRPWFIKSSENYIQNGVGISLSLNEKLNIILRHIDLEVKEKGDYIGIREMRKFMQAYVTGMRGATHFRSKLNTVQSKDELIALLMGFFAIKEAI